MDATLGQLRSLEFEVDPEDVARLAPLEHSHINFLGRYSFSMADPVSRGELRPLRNPDEDLEMAG